MADRLEYSIVLKHLKLTNFRCFQDLEVDFDDKLTVFIAKNGGGKTAILDAVAEGLKAYLASFKIKGFEKSTLSPVTDIREGSPFSDIEIQATVSRIFPYEAIAAEQGSVLYSSTTKEVEKIDLSSWDSVAEDNRFATELRRSSGSYFITDKYTSFNRDVHYFKQIHSETNLPILAYYGGDSVNIAYDAKSKTSFERTEILYKDALNPVRFSFTPFYNWYKAQEDRMFRIMDKAAPEYKAIENKLAKISYAIENILNDDPNNKVYTNLRINEDLQMGMDKKQSDGGTQFIRISQFSSGEKALFAFVAGLGLRLIHSQLDVEYAESEGVGEIHGRGIVLIDEVDLHLHPKWQRKVVGKLMEIFPDMQWVMTTHSPYVLQNIKPENLRIYRLDNGIATQSFIEHYGRDVDAIAYDLQGVSGRPKEIKDRLDEIYSMIDNLGGNDLKDITQKVDSLSVFLTELDQDIINIRTQLEFANA